MRKLERNECAVLKGGLLKGILEVAKVALNFIPNLIGQITTAVHTGMIIRQRPDKFNSDMKNMKLEVDNTKSNVAKIEVEKVSLERFGLPEGSRPIMC